MPPMATNNGYTTDGNKYCLMVIDRKHLRHLTLVDSMPPISYDAAHFHNIRLNVVIYWIIIHAAQLYADSVVDCQ